MTPNAKRSPGERAATTSTLTALKSSPILQPDASKSAVKFQPMPHLSPEQYSALKSDIEANSIIVPIVVDQHGRIIDGHNRKQIADQLGIVCPSEVHQVADDAEAENLAVTLNCARRHLSREQVRKIVRNEIERCPDDSDRAIARRVGCSPSTVGSVRKVSNLDSAILNWQFRTNPDGVEYSRDVARFVGYLWMLHYPEGLAGMANNGAVTLTCGGLDCELCHVAIEGDDSQ